MVVPIHRARLPDPTGTFKDRPREDTDFLKELVGALQREIDLRLPISTAQHEVLLLSPNGSVYAITVDDLGVIKRTLMSQAT